MIKKRDKERDAAQAELKMIEEGLVKKEEKYSALLSLKVRSSCVC
jgi:hypothetical protein